MSVFFGAFNKAIASEIESKVPQAWKPRKYEPNPQQQEFIDALIGSDENLNMIACAGTGKTSTLLLALPYIADSPADVTVSTMHAAGFRAWNATIPRGQRVRVEADKLRTMIDELAANNDIYLKYGLVIRKWVSFAKQSGFGVTGDFPQLDADDKWLELFDYFSLADDFKNGGTSPENLLPACKSVYLKSLELCKTVVDFDDMLLAPLYYAGKFRVYDWVLIDEAQDTNSVRRELAIRMLRPGTGRLIAVGDPNQAIYGFTGADSDAMDRIRNRMNSKELPLTVTYRCPKLIVQQAQQWVPAIMAHDSAPQGTVDTIRLERTPESDAPCFWDLTFGPDDVILCRVNKPIVVLAYMMLRKRIPCRIEGRDIGQSLITLCKKWRVTELDDLVEKLETYKDREVAKYLRSKSESKAAAIEDKVDTLLCIVEACQSEGKSHVQDVIDLINNMFGDTPEGQKPRCLTLSSVHKSKGREWRRVFILGRDRYMPSKWAKQDWEKRQEQNLLYVAVTRSMSELVDIILPDTWK